MTRHKLHARLGATAIAAALALSSTPLLAQQATSDTTQTAPLTAPATDTAPPAESAPTVAVPEITTTTKDTPASTSAAAAPAHSTVLHRTSSTAHAATAQTASRGVVTHSVPREAPASAAPSTPLGNVRSTKTASAPSAGPPPLAQIAGPPPAAANANQRPQPNSADEIIGAAIFALIVLGAIAFAMARRRRTRERVYEEEAYEPQTAFVDSEPVQSRSRVVEEQRSIIAPETSAFAWGDHPDAGRLEPPVAVAGAEEAQPSTLPNGFDLSRFGPHVQAAYRGPTPDNPSLSLRNRLRRAAAMDQKERATGIRAGDMPMSGEAVAERGELADA